MRRNHLHIWHGKRKFVKRKKIVVYARVLKCFKDLKRLLKHDESAWSLMIETLQIMKFSQKKLTIQIILWFPWWLSKILGTILKQCPPPWQLLLLCLHPYGISSFTLMWKQNFLTWRPIESNCRNPTWSIHEEGGVQSM